jgi:hypothetical protein
MPTDTGNTFSDIPLDQFEILAFCAKKSCSLD